MTRPCPSGKTQAATADAAKGVAHWIAMRMNAEGHLAPDLFVYRCRECRRWHVTKRPTWDGEPNVLGWKAAPEELQRWAMGAAQNGDRHSPV